MTAPCCCYQPVSKTSYTDQAWWGVLKQRRHTLQVASFDDSHQGLQPKHRQTIEVRLEKQGRRIYMCMRERVEVVPALAEALMMHLLPQGFEPWNQQAEHGGMAMRARQQEHLRQAGLSEHDTASHT